MSKLENAEPIILEILEALLSGYGEYFYPYSYLEKQTGRSRKELKKYVDILKKLGYVTYARGLMGEDGGVAGSGFGIAHDKYDEVEMATRLVKAENLPENMVIEFNGKKYKLREWQEVL